MQRLPFRVPQRHQDVDDPDDQEHGLHVRDRPEQSPDDRRRPAQPLGAATAVDRHHAQTDHELAGRRGAPAQEQRDVRRVHPQTHQQQDQLVRCPTAVPSRPAAAASAGPAGPPPRWPGSSHPGWTRAGGRSAAAAARSTHRRSRRRSRPPAPATTSPPGAPRPRWSARAWPRRAPGRRPGARVGRLPVRVLLGRLPVGVLLGRLPVRLRRVLRLTAGPAPAVAVPRSRSVGWSATTASRPSSARWPG